MKRIIALIIMSVMLMSVMLTLYSCGDSPTGGEIKTFDDIDGKTIGAIIGDAFTPVMAEKYPNAKFLYYDTIADILAGLNGRKTDAAVLDEMAFDVASKDFPYMKKLPGYIVPSDFGFIFPKNSDSLLALFNKFLSDAEQSGELKEIIDYWSDAGNSAERTLDIDGLSANNGYLDFGFSSVVGAPFVFVGDGQYKGMDVEIAYRFCKEYGYGLNCMDFDFKGLLSSVSSGKCQFGASSITMTDERKQSLDFSIPYIRSGAVIAVMDLDSDTSATPAFSTLSEVSGKRIGVTTGNSYELLVKDKLNVSNLSYFNNLPDLIEALKLGKIDALISEDSPLIYDHGDDKDIYILKEELASVDAGYAFPKTPQGYKLRDEFNAFLEIASADGTLDKLLQDSFDHNFTGWTDYESLPATNGTVNFATSCLFPPMAFVEDGNKVGFEIELVAKFCEYKGYALILHDMSWESVLASLGTKCDMAAAQLNVSKEREEEVCFSNASHVSQVLVAVHMQSAETTGFFQSVAQSFEKTFIRENRWQLFLNGILQTLLITAMSVLCGTVLGFVIYLLCKDGSKVANVIANVCVYIIQGMPLVVLLMILYYIVFGRTSISGTWVSIIAFTLVFGSAVFNMLKTGVKAIDKGQYEAAYALGFSKNRTFFKIILPQAAAHFMPVYKGEIIALIKATAIVGYISVQDLTKVGDIIRSRTYDAFFPLIAIAVFYFILAALLILLVGLLFRLFDPKKRKPEQILKGVDSDD